MLSTNPDTKRCPTCAMVKPHTDFGKPNWAGALPSRCKGCEAARKRAEYAAPQVRVGAFPERKKCPVCAETKPHSAFGKTRRAGSVVLQSSCKKCEAARGRKAYDLMSEEGKRVVRARQSLNQKRLRAAGGKVGAFILMDSRKADRRAKRANDLDRPFIEATIKGGCLYCGETDLRMTLDRIDNTLGHTKSNVVPACIRCNYTRKDMPHAAWLIVAEGMRKAREAGEFGVWTGQARRSDAANKRRASPKGT